MSRLAALALTLALAGPVAAEDYPAHVPCVGVTVRGPFTVIGPCHVEVEAGGRVVVYFASDAPVTTLPLLIVRQAGKAAGPAPAGVSIAVVRLYPEPASKAHLIKAVVTNTGDEADVLVEAWLAR